MQDHDQGVKTAKNIAAIVYLLVLIFLVGGSYLDQHRDAERVSIASAAHKP